MIDARIALVVVLGALLSSCHLIGGQADACDPTNPIATCPSGFTCGDSGLCEQIPPVTTLFDNENGVALLAAEDTTIVWATAGNGGCIRVGALNAKPASTVHCVGANESIAGLALAGLVYYVVDAPQNDRVESIAPTSTTSDAPAVLPFAPGANVRSVDEGGPNQLVARNDNGTQIVGWLPLHGSADGGVAERLLVTGTTTNDAQYLGLTDGDPVGGIALNKTGLFWIESGLYARLVGRDTSTQDEDGTVALAFSDSGTHTKFVKGQGWASLTSGNTVFISTRDAHDAGGLISADGSFDPDFLQEDEVFHQIDPDDPNHYAAGLATDGTTLYFTTAGGGTQSKPGLFKVPLVGGKPTRLHTLDVGGGPLLLIRNEQLVWAEPSKSRIRSVLLRLQTLHDE